MALAGKVRALVASGVAGTLLRRRTQAGWSAVPARTAVGTMLPKPKKVAFGLLRVLSVFVTFAYFGSVIGRKVVSLVEGHEAFADDGLFLCCDITASNGK